MRPSKRSTAPGISSIGIQLNSGDGETDKGKINASLLSRLVVVVRRRPVVLLGIVFLALVAVISFTTSSTGVQTETTAPQNLETTTTPNPTPSPSPPKHRKIDCHELMAGQNDSAQKFVMARTKTPVPFDMSTYPADQDIWVSKSIQTHGCWECIMVREAVRALQQHENAFLLDLGGNIGMMALSAAAAGRDVYVFEPFRENYGHMCRSVELNGFQNLLNLYNLALARHETIVEFQMAGSNQGGISVKESQDNTAEQKEGVDFARCVTLDSMMDLIPQDRPVVFKLDVEGAEVDALMGGINYLKKADIVLALMELRWEKLFQYANDTDTIFEMFRSKGLVPIRHKIVLGEDWRRWTKDEEFFDLAWVKK